MDKDNKQYIDRTRACFNLNAKINIHIQTEEAAKSHYTKLCEILFVPATFLFKKSGNGKGWMEGRHYFLHLPVSILFQLYFFSVLQSLQRFSKHFFFTAKII
jgi:hypothetical protein